MQISGIFHLHQGRVAATASDIPDGVRSVATTDGEIPVYKGSYAAFPEEIYEGSEPVEVPEVYGGSEAVFTDSGEEHDKTPLNQVVTISILFHHSNRF